MANRLDSPPLSTKPQSTLQKILTSAVNEVGMEAALVAIMAIGGIAVSAQDGDTLNIIYWQAPSTMNAFLSGGTKEQEAMSMWN